MELKYSICITNNKENFNQIKAEINNKLKILPLFSYELNNKWEMLYYKIGYSKKNKIVEIAETYGESIIDIKTLENKGKK